MKGNAKKVKDEIVKPTLQYLVLCDAVSMPDQRGKVSFIGVFDKFLRLGIIPHFAIAVGWKNGKGNFKFNIKLLDPELNLLFETPEMELPLTHETQAAPAYLSIDGMNFAKPGVYWIEVLLDNE